MDAAATDQVLEVLDRRPWAREILERALDLEGRPDLSGLGWDHDDVDVPGHLLYQLSTDGLIRCTYRSRSTKCYRLRDAEVVRLALSAEPPVATGCAVEATMPADLFDVVVGLERPKRLLHQAVSAERPVHLLLLGGPGTAKSLILSELARLPGAVQALGATSSKAGLVDVLLGDTVRWLLLDELDKASARDLVVLLSLMETGIVRKHVRGHHVERHCVTSVFAGANSVEHVRPELLDRFHVLELPSYTAQEYRDVVEGVLARREGLDAEDAAYIAALVAQRATRSVRAAVRIARMAHGDREEAARLVAELL